MGAPLTEPGPLEIDCLIRLYCMRLCPPTVSKTSILPTSPFIIFINTSLSCPLK